jgi:hypothetical protein
MNWTVKPLPKSGPGALIRCPASYNNYGAKHLTTLYCPLTKKHYIFGGDYSGFADPKYQGMSGDSFRTDIWSYHVPTDTWKLEQGADVADGEIMPWLPDWGCYAWDSIRKVFWFSSGATAGFTNQGKFVATAATGLSIAFTGGKIPPDPFVNPNGTWGCVDNQRNYIEFDPVAHTTHVNQTGFTEGRIPLYEAVATNGVIARPLTNRRPYWMVWGAGFVDPRHFADPHKLICLDPLTMKWSDPGLPEFRQQFPGTVMLDGRNLTALRTTKCLIHDPDTDQLLQLGDTFVAHFSFAERKWSLKDVAFWNQGQNHAVRVGRKIYAVAPRGYGEPLKSYGFSYDIDSRTQTRHGEVPHLTGIDNRTGLPNGSSSEMVNLKHDPKRNLLYYCEVMSPFLSPYGYGETGAFVNMHAWHILKGEDRWETLTTTFDPENPPHGGQFGFDPEQDKFFTWGIPGSAGADFPGFNHPDLYLWSPSGATPEEPPPPPPPPEPEPTMSDAEKLIAVRATLVQAIGIIDAQPEPIPNQPPTLVLTVTPQVITDLPAIVTLAVEALDPDGTVVKVDFEVDGTLFNTDLIVPFEAQYEITTPGEHLFTAIAHDDKGATASVTSTVAATDAPPEPTPEPSQGTILAPLIKGAPVEYGGQGVDQPMSPTGVARITLAWNGAAFDYADPRFFIPTPSGHGDLYYNGSLELKVPNGPVRLIHDQTHFPPDERVNGYTAVNVSGVELPGNGYEIGTTKPVQPFVGGLFNSGYGPGCVIYKDGKPAGRHIYGGAIWLPTQKRVLLLSGATWPLGLGDVYSGWLDPVTGLWERKANIARGYGGIVSAYDAKRDRVVWAWGGLSLYSYDPALDKHTLIPRQSQSELGGIATPFAQIAIDPVGDYVYAIHKGGWGNNRPTYVGCILRMKLGMATAQPWEKVPVSGDLTVLQGISPGFEYDEDRQAFVLWGVEDPGAVHVLPLSTFAMERIPLPTTPTIADTVNGVWGRFRRYAPNKYALLASARQPLFPIDL